MYRVCDGLEASNTFWNASSAKRALNCNGAGTSGWRGVMVPDTIWGLDINPSADIHDWDYAEGETLIDKDSADDRFRRNMRSQIKRAAKASWLGWLLHIPRRYRAFTYYLAVSESDAALVAFGESELI